MKGTIGFLFFMLFLAGFALVNLQARQQENKGTASAVAGSSPLTAGDWRALRMFGNTVPGNVELSVSFFDDGRLQGSAGCNRYSGRYEQGAEGFRVASMRATRRQCDAEVMTLERQLFEVFREARASELADGDLRLLDKDGEWLATFAAAERLPAGPAATP